MLQFVVGTGFELIGNGHLIRPLEPLRIDDVGNEPFIPAAEPSFSSSASLCHVILSSAFFDVCSLIGIPPTYSSKIGAAFGRRAAGEDNLDKVLPFIHKNFSQNLSGMVATTH